CVLSGQEMTRTIWQDFDVPRSPARLAARLLVAGLAMLAPLSPSSGEQAAGPAVHPDQWPTLRPAIAADPALEARIDALLGRLTVEEKVGQIVQADISTITPDDLRRYPLGAILSGGSSGPGGNDYAPAEDWLALAEA